MKKVILIVFLLISYQIGAQSQTRNSLTKNEVFLLIDVTDTMLYHQDIMPDIQHNLGNFLTRNGFLPLAEKHSLSISMSSMALGNINVSSASISLPQTGLSVMEQKRLSNPSPIVELVKGNLKEYGKQCHTYKKTDIVASALKSILQSDPNANSSTFFIFTDCYENSSLANFYKRIPVEKDIPTLLSKVDPSLIEQVRSMATESNITVVIVLKKKNQEANDFKLKEFWRSLFKTIGFNSIQFVDNLSNKINISNL